MLAGILLLYHLRFAICKACCNLCGSLSMVLAEGSAPFGVVNTATAAGWHNALAASFDPSMRSAETSTSLFF